MLEKTGVVETVGRERVGTRVEDVVVVEVLVRLSFRGVISLV